MFFTISHVFFFGVPKRLPEVVKFLSEMQEKFHRMLKLFIGCGGCFSRKADEEKGAGKKWILGGLSEKNKGKA